MTKVIAFGAFDPLHEGHKDFLRQAKELGEYLIVVVAHDDAVRAYKKREPHLIETERAAQVRTLPDVDEAIVGPTSVDPYHVLGQLEFDIIAMGFNQQPSDEFVRRALDERGKQSVKIIRLKPYQPERYRPD
ncbi:MAG: adenylyltransferase/cytidyltransferase family protein [Candidatus Andersenbacteria bacterium]